MEIAILVRYCGQLGGTNLSRPTVPERETLTFLIFATPGRDNG